jgi:hypothetical protein
MIDDDDNTATAAGTKEKLDSKNMCKMQQAFDVAPCLLWFNITRHLNGYLRSKKKKINSRSV